MERKFKTGDVVRLNSDSDKIADNYPMTVRMYSVEGGILSASRTKDLYGNSADKIVICDWRTDNGNRLQNEFLEDQLEKYSSL